MRFSGLCVLPSLASKPPCLHEGCPFGQHQEVPLSASCTAGSKVTFSRLLSQGAHLPPKFLLITVIFSWNYFCFLKPKVSKGGSVAKEQTGTAEDAAPYREDPQCHNPGARTKNALAKPHPDVLSVCDRHARVAILGQHHC